MILQTAIGNISLGCKNGSLFCEFGKHAVEREPSKKLAKQLNDYFEGKKIKAFDAPIPISTPFTMKCWAACRRIPYGETVSYKELAEMAGSPLAMRAAGQAMRNNPLTIITPCHRVISSSGNLHGYSGSMNRRGSSLRRKQFLLDLEKSIIES